MTQEEWRAIPGYENSYEVSNQGLVRSLDRLDARGRRRRGKFMSLNPQQSGHLTVALHVNRVRTTFLVHHLVLMAFVGPRPDGLEGCHWDDNPGNNHIENLRWDTRSANILDSVRNGTHHMARRMECPRGHEYTTENTYVHPSGSRLCKECRRIYREEHREERREKGREYMRRRRAANPREVVIKTECPMGHPYTEENTYQGSSGRSCLTCIRARRKKDYEQNRERYIARAAEWRLSNPDRARELSREGQRRYRQKLKDKAAQ